MTSENKVSLKHVFSNFNSDSIHCLLLNIIIIYSKTDETNNINENIFLSENAMNQPTPQKNKDIQQTSVQKKLF